MPRRTYLAIMVLFLLAWTTFVLPSLEQGGSEYTQRIILNIYVDRTGKALVTGYVENPKELNFLNTSQYSYENETNQLYALTNALTKKEGDIWTLILGSPGYFEDYRLTFYLPSDIKVMNLSSSQGLEYLLSASNESLVVEFQGYDVKDPVINIEYQQTLNANTNTKNSSSVLLPVILILALGAVASFLWRYKTRRPQVVSTPTGLEEHADSLENSQSHDGSVSFESEDSDEVKDAVTDANVQPLSQLDEETQISRGLNTSKEPLNPEEQILSDAEKLSSLGEFKRETKDDTAINEAKPSVPNEKIRISSEMVAIMETLTPRERVILQALIDRGGRTTQADLRYETRTPKSSLTGILNSLERRKLVTKKEWGRTNVIELSEWFLSKKER